MFKLEHTDQVVQILFSFLDLINIFNNNRYTS